ncbi:MAG TPA: VOC family protein [Acidimicrobiales bacterium]|nr:VOC family protein [Acidimicrobiales bacterium]
MRIGNVAIDCNDLDAMKAFWMRLTGFRELGGDESFAFLGDPEHMGRTKLFLQKVPEPRVGKNRVHIDLYVEDREAAAAEVEAAGGQRVAEHENGPIRWWVVTDPEGNEFCVVQVPKAEG